MAELKNVISKNEKLILQAMYRERRPVSMREIAEESGISWVTARKYLKELINKKIVKAKGNKWELNYEYLE